LEGNEAMTKHKNELLADIHQLEQTLKLEKNQVSELKDDLLIHKARLEKALKTNEAIIEHKQELLAHIHQLEQT
jgi:hypothetical protein